MVEQLDGLLGVVVSVNLSLKERPNCSVIFCEPCISVAITMRLRMATVQMYDGVYFGFSTRGIFPVVQGLIHVKKVFLWQLVFPFDPDRYIHLSFNEGTREETIVSPHLSQHRVPFRVNKTEIM